MALAARAPTAVAAEAEAYADGRGARGGARRGHRVGKHFDLTPAGLIKQLNLRRPIFRATAAYGHFGRTEATFTWERTDKARMLAKGV